MSTNIVPKTYVSLVKLAVKAVAGAEALGDSVGLGQNARSLWPSASEIGRFEL